jgi:predicted Zn-dependent protease
MKQICITLFVLISSAAAFGQASIPHPSPAEDRIALFSREIEKDPTKANLYTELAIALLRRERETSDKSLLDRAQVALDKSLKLAPANSEAQKVEAVLLLGKHEFASALALAQSLNQKVPDDVMTYGYIADADLALGDYTNAEKAAQWMLNLRSHNVPGLICGAELRQVFGQSDGALQFLNESYQSMAPDQFEEIARTLTRMAEINLTMGRLDVADQLIRNALTFFPNYYLALEVEARVRDAQHKYAEAANILHLRNQQFPQPESIYAEAKALDNAGDTTKAKELYASFEQIALSKSSRADNDNRDLVLYYLGREHDPGEALRIVRWTISQRHDVWTLDSLAIALYANGNYVEAKKQIEAALEPGIRDGNIFYHAAQINAALKNQPATVQYLKLSLEANPESEVSGNARKLLTSLATPEYGGR